MAKKASMNLEEIRLYNMVDMGLRYSGMIRLYKEGSKQKLINKTLTILPQIANSDSIEAFDKVHTNFCTWAKASIFLAKPRKRGIVISYGQAAKTLDVTLSVLIYYCNWPNQTKAKKLIKWIHAAIDNDMMRYLKRNYPEAIKSWPTAIQSVDNRIYQKLQNLVILFISEKDPEIKFPVQFDDKYWFLLKEGLPVAS